MTEIRKETGSLTGKKYKPGMLFKFELAIPMAGVEKFAMLDLPDGATPLEIAVTDKLYVRTEAGIYCRELCSDCVTDSEEKRKNISYYD